MYHPAMQCILRQATMQVQNKSTHAISLSWKLFNKILSEVTERHFQSKANMGDENGTYYCANRQVFGVNFMTSEVVSCQMHYKNDINKVSFSTGLSYRDLVKSICYGMYSVATVTEYNEQNHQMDEIPNLLPDSSQWTPW